VRLLSDMEKCQVTLYDPFIGYLVAISATVLLDQSLRRHGENQEVVEQKFRLCREYVKRVSSISLSMKNAVGTALHFASPVLTSCEATIVGQASRSPQAHHLCAAS
jgi:hypothetical protein